MEQNGNYYYDANPSQNGYQSASFTNNLYVYFNREAYTINFMDGAYVNGNGAFIELADRGNVDKLGLGVFIDDICLFFRDNSQLCLSRGQGCFRIQPFLYPGLVAENLPHFVGAKQETVNLAVNNGGWHDIKPLSLSKPYGCIQSFFVLITS